MDRKHHGERGVENANGRCLAFNVQVVVNPNAISRLVGERLEADSTDLVLRIQLQQPRRHLQTEPVAFDVLARRGNRQATESVERNLKKDVHVVALDSETNAL